MDNNIASKESQLKYKNFFLDLTIVISNKNE